MGVTGGPNKSRDGLVLSLDSGNRRSSLRRTQTSNILTDPGTWVTGSDGQPGYSRNGDVAEQNRLLVTDDPWGRKSITWRTTPDADSNADGGWNSSYFSVDTEYTYRYSIWVRRYTSGTGGTFYFGMSPNPIRNDNHVTQSNPYFSYPAISSLTEDQWYLVVSHVFYEGYQGSRHPESGWYENGIKITDKSYGNCGTQDTRWDPGTTTARHRTYHYYTTNTASGIEFAYPRIDKVDGKEPSISELINKGESGWTDLISKTSFSFDDKIDYNFAGKKSGFDFDGVNDYLICNNIGIDDYSKPFSIECVFKATGTWANSYISNIVGINGSYAGFYGLGKKNTSDVSFLVRDANYNELAFTLTDTSKFNHLVGVWDSANGQMRFYINGELENFSSVSKTGAPDSTALYLGGQRAFGGNLGTWYEGEIPIVNYYKKALNDNEVAINFQNYKNRFNI